MKTKKVLSVLLTLCLFVNVSFAFDPYADEEVEKKSYKKLYYGIALTLLGGFLAYDGFSLEKVDVSKPSVDFLTVSHSEWVHRTSTIDNHVYELRSGISLNNVQGVNYGYSDYEKYEIKNNNAPSDYNPDKHGYKPEYYDRYTVEPNILYNRGNVDLRNLTIEVAYKFKDGTYIGINGEHVKGEYYYIDVEDPETGGKRKEQVSVFHVAEINENVEVAPNTKISPDDPRIKTYTFSKNKDLESLNKGDGVTWQDVWNYSSTQTTNPNDNPRSARAYTTGISTDNETNNDDVGTENDGNENVNENNESSEYFNPGTIGLNLGKDTPFLMEVRVKLKKNQQYTPIYETKHKSDLEGVAGVFIGIAGIYFIIDHFFDMHKFNAYAKRHHLNLKLATASNQYKLMLQKRI